MKFATHFLRSGILISAAFIASAGSAAEKHALLVGASNYPSLPESRQLQGARNDVLLMRKVLSNMGFQPANISVLTDKLEGATTPTRKAIFTALHQIQEKSMPGDFVYLHFSGHGSRQPILDKKLSSGETDGLDEIFLPSDIGRWDGKTATVKNAIIDDEFNAVINAIRKKGAFVWAVFDTCHAGTLSRGEKDIEERSREVLPSELGIPAHLFSKTRQSNRGAAQQRDAMLSSDAHETGRGGFIGFYAAQSDQITTEAKFKIENNYASHGTFSFALAQILSSQPSLSYRELGQQILNRYASHSRFFPTPLFEGAQLDTQVFDKSTISRKGQWPIHRNANGGLSIPSGELHHINRDSVFTFVDNPDAEANSSQIHFTVKAVSAIDTELSTIDAKTKQIIITQDNTIGGYARLIRLGIQKQITISFDERKMSSTMTASLQKLSTSGLANTGISWVKKSNKNAHDFELISKDKTMCLLATDMPQTCRSELAWLPISSKIAANLQALTARATHLRKVSNLLSIAEQFPAKAGLKKFDIRLYATPKNSTKKIALTQARWAEVSAGDKLIIELENNTTRSVDASLLFVDSAHHIQAVFPYQHGEINRIEPLGKHEIVLDITSATLGVEKLVAILAEAQPHSMMQDFSFLADSRPDRLHRGNDDDATDQELGTLFRDTVFTNRIEETQEPKRSGENKTTGKFDGHNAIRLFNWIVK